MKSVAEALELMLPTFVPRDVVSLPVSEALGYVLASRVVTSSELPPFSNSAMDGYAVRSHDVIRASREHPVRLKLCGEVRAGDDVSKTGISVEAGAAARIFTGAPLPTGADAVIMQEDTVAEGDHVVAFACADRGKHVRARGSDLALGSVAIDVGTSIGPGEISLLLSQGRTEVQVHRRPRVAIFSTGDELREAGDPVVEGTIVNTNSHALAAQVTLAGGVPTVLPIAPDDPELLRARIEEGLRYDVLITSGGVSVGEYDYGRVAFERAGVELSFWKLRIKPGKPVVFGTRNGVPVIGLPGNPVSAMVTFEVLVRPGLRRMLGDRHPFSPIMVAYSASDYRRRPGRTEFLRVRLSHDGARLLAHPHPMQGSGSLPSMVNIDALAVVPAEREYVREGDRLSVILLPWLSGPPRIPAVYY